MGALVALLYRDQTGRGQHIDVDMHAAQNITTEAGSYSWLVAKQTVQRQTGRHAGVNPSPPTQVQCADGRWVTTGFPGRRGDDYRRLLAWLDDLGLRERFPEWPLLEHGSAIDRIDLSRIAVDDEVRAIVMAARQALVFIASSIPAVDFFTGGQSRNFQVGIIYSPEEVMEDAHFIERGFPVRVAHPDLGRDFTYPGAPYLFHGSPWRIQRRAPLLGEHTAEVMREVGVGAAAG
jgi:crotonobetainyl-CoA:carnitine CoA-transferase CaiB-like acyl-CoA transferase